MRKRIFSFIIFLSICSILFAQRFRDLGVFIAPNANPLSIAAGGSAINGIDFYSKEISVSDPDHGAVAFFVAEFTRSVGSYDTVDFEFEASHDNGETWTTDYYVKMEIPTNTRAENNEVRAGKFINVSGVSKVRLSRITNNDSSNDLTNCNVLISIRIQRR